MAVATAVIMVGVVVVAVGRGGEMAYFSSDYAPLDLGAVAATDVVLLRPPTSIWGYNIQVTDEALSRVARALSQRDIRIASLEQQVADLRAEWDMQMTSPHAPPSAEGRAARWEARAAGWDPAASLRRTGVEGLAGREAVPATRPHPIAGNIGSRGAAGRGAAPGKVTSPAEATSPLDAAASGHAPSPGEPNQAGEPNHAGETNHAGEANRGGETASPEEAASPRDADPPPAKGGPDAPGGPAGTVERRGQTDAGNGQAREEDRPARTASSAAASEDGAAVAEPGEGAAVTKPGGAAGSGPGGGQTRPGTGDGATGSGD